MASQISRAVRREHLTYCSFRKLARLERCVELTLEREVPGAVVEFGVALGGSAIVLTKRCRDRHFHGFDLFGMIPEPSSEKDDIVSRERYKTIASGQADGIDGATYYGYRTNLFDEVVEAFARHGCPVDGRRVFLHKGLFHETWEKFPADRLISVAHIDCDWYEPVTFCLNAALPRLAKGSMLILDDYEDYGGARAAVDEFLLMHKNRFTVDLGENVVLVHR